MGQSSPARVAACFPNLLVPRLQRLSRGGLTRRQGLERSNCSMLSPGVPCVADGRLAG